MLLELTPAPIHLRNFTRVEASHANAHARTIAFYSYVWFKYDILSLHCCKLHSVVVSMLSYQPSAPGFDLRLGSKCVMQYAGSGKEMHEAISFLCFKTLRYSLGWGRDASLRG